MPLFFSKRGRTWLVALTIAIALLGAWVAAGGEAYWPLIIR